MIPPRHITLHALERFKARWPHPTPPPKWDDELQRLLAQAKETDIGAGNAIRLMNHGLKPARYFTIDGWRFITDETAQRLLTCERINFYSRPAGSLSMKDRRRLKRERKKKPRGKSPGQ